MEMASRCLLRQKWNVEGVICAPLLDLIDARASFSFVVLQVMCL